MLLIDIDDFKQLNDRLGHAAGDELLTRIAPILNDCVRETDLVARYGGEEFVMLALNTDPAARSRWPRRCAPRSPRARSSSTTRCARCASRCRSASPSSAATASASSRRADEALYRAKAEGKNCVVVERGRPTGPPDPDRGRGRDVARRRGAAIAPRRAGGCAMLAA